jgi:hypothetical protein
MALKRAWAQVNRVGVTARRRQVTVKRIAVATRWGSAQGGAGDARLSVHDPIEEGEPIAPDDEDSLFMGLLRLHLASLLEPVGHPALAASLRELIGAGSAAGERAARVRAGQVFDSLPVTEISDRAEPGTGWPRSPGV